MGFNINGPSNLPIIQGSQSLGKDGGGGGNTGFMNMRGGKKKKSNQNEEDNSVFLEEETEDRFVKKEKSSNIEKKPVKENKLINTLTKFIKKPKSASQKYLDVFLKQNSDFDSTSDSFERKQDEEHFEINLPKQNVNLEEDDEYEIIDDSTDFATDNFDDNDDGYYDDINV